MKQLATPENLVWSVARSLEPASYAQIAAEVELEACRRGVAPFWVWHAFRRLCKRGEIHLTPDGYRTRTAAVARLMRAER